MYDHLEAEGRQARAGGGGSGPVAQAAGTPAWAARVSIRRARAIFVANPHVLGHPAGPRSVPRLLANPRNAIGNGAGARCCYRDTSRT